MKRIVFLLFVLFFISNVWGIRINEIEINPIDGSAGKEWIELYNEGEDLDISEWEIYDGITKPKKIYTIPPGTIIKEKDYYVIELSKAVLNNNGDFVILYNAGGEEIDRSEMLKETSWDSKTWQLCGNWKFIEATKNKENNCDNGEDKKENKEYDNLKNEEIKEYKKEEIKTTKSVINLTPKDIKTNENISNSNKTKYAKYGLVIFCILLLVLFVLKFTKQNDKLE